jgi:hypothetical protein
MQPLDWVLAVTTDSKKHSRQLTVRLQHIIYLQCSLQNSFKQNSYLIQLYESSSTHQLRYAPWIHEPKHRLKDKQVLRQLSRNNAIDDFCRNLPMWVDFHDDPTRSACKFHAENSLWQPHLLKLNNTNLWNKHTPSWDIPLAPLAAPILNSTAYQAVKQTEANQSTQTTKQHVRNAHWWAHTYM